MWKRLKMAIVMFAALFGASKVHKAYLDYHYAHQVGQSIVRLLGKGGGGTGFQMEWHGKQYILTNDHVCGLADQDNTLMVDSPFAPIQYSHIIARSASTDLCLLSPTEQLQPLTLGDHNFEKGERVLILGHPLLDKLTLSKGSAGKIRKIDVLLNFIMTPEDEQACTLPKNKIITILFGLFKVCIIRVDAQYTTAKIKPGNSGSPVIDEYDKVRGIAFASAGQVGKAEIIPFEDIRKFLNSYEHHKTYKHAHVR